MLHGGTIHHLVENLLMSLYLAAEPEDFTPLDPAAIVFPVGGTPTTVCSTFTIQLDAEVEGDEDFTVEIVRISSGSPHAMIDDASTTTITIIDDDGE